MLFGLVATVLAYSVQKCPTDLPTEPVVPVTPGTPSTPITPGPVDPLRLPIQDAVVQGTTERSVRVFYNIPFAQAPTGNLRFQPPQPVRLSGTIDGTKPGKECIQIGNNANSSEDCLQINVFTPQNATNLPVVVYVYGGGFDSGSALVPLYNGTAIVERSNVVYAVFNYRVGIFGFLGGHNEENNVGLLDQKLAFEWVRRNIAVFGGNPNQVTAMGQSAGAISIGAHMVADANQKLFDRAILLSGGPLLRYSPPRTEQGKFQAILRQTNCTDIACLKGLEPLALVNATSRIPYGIGIGSTTSYIKEQALPRVLAGQVSRIPVLVQTTKDEGTFFSLSVQSREAVPTYIRGQSPYFNETTFTNLDQFYSVEKYPAPFFAAGDYFGDLVFQCPVRALSQSFSRQQVPIFNSAYNYKNKINFFGIPFDIGVFHGADLPFLFLAWPILDPSEFELARSIHDRFFRFVKGEATLDEKWPVYGNGSRYDIEKARVIEDTERSAKCDFLVDVIQKTY
jgi:para-nitrobenzyl esterase